MFEPSNIVITLPSRRIMVHEIKDPDGNSHGWLAETFNQDNYVRAENRDEAVGALVFKISNTVYVY